MQMDELAAQLVDRLARIETKLDTKFEGYDSRLTLIETRIPDQDHESRIRKLERVVWIASGIAAAGGGVVGNFLSQVTGA